MINIKDFDSNLLKLDKKSYRNIAIYCIEYVTEKDKYVINRVNPFYLIAYEEDGFIEEKEGNKYLNFAFTDSNTEALKKYAEIWSGIEDQIKAINSGKSGEYGKDYMKIKFNLDDDVPLNKHLKFINLTIIVGTVFEEDGKYYPKMFLGECLYELQKCYSMKELMSLKELTLISQINQKSV